MADKKLILLSKNVFFASEIYFVTVNKKLIKQMAWALDTNNLFGFVIIPLLFKYVMHVLFKYFSLCL